ncbi:hypothetical protein FACS1894186_8120 [Alphaproteobacteria bacterium]|nr:hypothetical protein FACS1894186_8120 [Alphaproteobacteria bacterium]
MTKRLKTSLLLATALAAGTIAYGAHAQSDGQAASKASYAAQNSGTGISDGQAASKASAAAGTGSPAGQSFMGAFGAAASGNFGAAASAVGGLIGGQAGALGSAIGAVASGDIAGIAGAIGQLAPELGPAAGVLGALASGDIGAIVGMVLQQIPALGGISVRDAPTNVRALNEAATNKAAAQSTHSESETQKLEKEAVGDAGPSELASSEGAETVVNSSLSRSEMAMVEQERQIARDGLIPGTQAYADKGYSATNPDYSAMGVKPLEQNQSMPEPQMTTLADGRQVDLNAYNMFSSSGNSSTGAKSSSNSSYDSTTGVYTGASSGNTPSSSYAGGSGPQVSDAQAASSAAYAQSQAANNSKIDFASLATSLLGGNGGAAMASLVGAAGLSTDQASFLGQAFGAVTGGNMNGVSGLLGQAAGLSGDQADFVAAALGAVQSGNISGMMGMLGQAMGGSGAGAAQGASITATANQRAEQMSFLSKPRDQWTTEEIRQGASYSQAQTQEVIDLYASSLASQNMDLKQAAQMADQIKQAATQSKNIREDNSKVNGVAAMSINDMLSRSNDTANKLIRLQAIMGMRGS